MDKKIDRRTMWQRVLKIGKDITKFMQVCSLHFKKSDYILLGNYINFLARLLNEIFFLFH